MDYLDLANSKDVKIEDNSGFDYKKYIVDSKETDQKINDFYTGKLKKGYEIGIPCFDKHFTFKEKSLYAFTGRKGIGKTSVMKLNQLMHSIVNDLIWVVAFQENSVWGVKVDYLQYFLGDYASDVEKNNPVLYYAASEWIDKHFIFLDVETIEEAVKVTEYLIKDGTNIHGLFLDPVNSFEFGYKDTGDTYKDGVYSSKKVLRWCLKNVSVHVSQHPNLSAARNKEKEIHPIDAEFGFWNNKAHFTWTLNREYNSNENIISVHNVREKLTGGFPTSADEPLIIEWFPTQINIRKGNEVYRNVIQYLVRKHNPLGWSYEPLEEDKPTYNASVDEAFGDDVPF